MTSRTKSVGRLARSVEIITQRPTIGSFLSSGNYRVLSIGPHKPHILRRQRSIAKYFDLRGGTKICIVSAYNIESPLARWWQPPQIFPRHLRRLRRSTAASGVFTSREVRVLTSMKQRTSAPHPSRSMPPRQRGERKLRATI